MNYLDIRWLRKVRKNHPEFFKKAKVLELGSWDINGNAWGLFADCEMVGVDWKPGKNVTHVTVAHETKFKEESFDTIISMNHLEHDPYWESSLRHNFPCLRKEGLIILSWATPQSTKHSADQDPSGKKGYYPKQLNEVVNLVSRNNFIILDKGERSNPYTGLMAYVVARKT